MVKIITDERAKEILEESRSSSDNFRVRYYRLNEDDGQKVIEFITPIYEVETNDEDLLGRIWEYEWSKNEAKVLMDGKEIIWGFGGPKSPNLRIFLRALTTNNIKMTDLPGTIWSAQRTGKWDYEYKLIGRKDKTSKKQSSKYIEKDEDYNTAIDVIKNLKNTSPDFIQDMKIAGLITAISLQGMMSEEKARKIIPLLEKDKIIKINKDKVTIL